MSDNASTRIESRRSLLRMGAMGAATTLMTGKITQGAVLTTPQETQGPFWIDPQLNRSDIRESRQGLLTYLVVTVSRLTSGRAVPVSGAWVDIWHCDAVGAYSGVSGAGNPNTIGQTFLRGYQATSARGLTRFRTIYPGWYTSRTIRIHARVRVFSGSSTTTNMTTQFFFDDDFSDYVFDNYSPYNSRSGVRDTYNENDNVYNTVSSGSTVASPDGDRLLLRMGSSGRSYVRASFNIVIA